MSESDLFPLKPDYTITEEFTEGALRSFSMGRKDFQRLVAPTQRLFRLVFLRRTSGQKEQMLDWYRRFEASFFRFEHETYLVEGTSYLKRSFPVIWGGPPKIQLESNEAWTMEADFVEAPGRPLLTADYPTFAAGHPFIAVAGKDVGADKIVIYSGYGLRTTGGTGQTVQLDGVSLGAAPITAKTDVPLGLHRVKFLAGAGGTGALEILI